MTPNAIDVIKLPAQVFKLFGLVLVINLICVGTLCHPRCEHYLTSEPKGSPDLRYFLAKARRHGWVVSATGENAFCPVCAKERANHDAVSRLLNRKSKIKNRKS